MLVHDAVAMVHSERVLTAFYNIWSGRTLAKQRFRARLRDDLSQVLAALADGKLSAQVAARFPLARTADALRLAESRTVAGKVVLTP